MGEQASSSLFFLHADIYHTVIKTHLVEIKTNNGSQLLNLPVGPEILHIGLTIDILEVFSVIVIDPRVTSYILRFESLFWSFLK